MSHPRPSKMCTTRATASGRRESETTRSSGEAAHRVMRRPLVAGDTSHVWAARTCGWAEPGGGPAAGGRRGGRRSLPGSTGLRWQRLAQAPTVKGKQDDLFFIDPQVGWSVNGRGNIFHTRDGGATWKQLLHQEGTYFRCVLFTS